MSTIGYLKAVLPVLLMSYVVQQGVAVSTLMWHTGPVLGVLAIMQVLWQNYGRSGEVPLYGGFIPYLGHALAFGADYSKLICGLVEASGDAPAFTVYIAGKRMTFIKSPEDFSSALRDIKRLDFTSVASAVMKDAFGMQIDPTSEAYHKWSSTTAEQYAMIRGTKLAPLMAKIHTELSSAIDAQERGLNLSTEMWVEVPDLYTLVTELMWSATALSVFGDALGTAESSELKAAQASFSKFDSFFPLLMAGVPHGALSGCGDAIKHLRSLFAGDATSCPSFSDIIRFRQEWLSVEGRIHGIGVQDKGTLQIAMVWAAFANTTPTAFWSLYCMVQGDCAQTCEQEARKILYPTSALPATRTVPEQEHLATSLSEDLPVISAVVSEALRLCIASLTVRDSSIAFDLQLKGTGSVVRIRKGDRVAVAPLLTHMNPEVYPDPGLFSVDRFLSSDDKVVGGRSIPRSIALQPFGGGVSMCPGRHLAVSEVRAFLAQISVRWDIEMGHGGSQKNGEMRMGGEGIPKLDMSRAGLGSLPPVGAVPCRIRKKKSY